MAVGALIVAAVLRQQDTIKPATPHATLEADVLPTPAPEDPLLTFRIGAQ